MLTIDRLSGIPVYEQIINAVERDIAIGSIKEGDKLPSVRELASALDVNPNTVQKSYTELQSRGVIITVASSGAFVAKNAIDRIRAHKSELIDKIRESLLELRFAGIDESVILNEVRKVYNLPVNSKEAAIDLPSASDTRNKKASVTITRKPLTTAKKPSTQIKEEKPAAAPTRKKMGIELL